MSGRFGRWPQRTRGRTTELLLDRSQVLRPRTVDDALWLAGIALEGRAEPGLGADETAEREALARALLDGSLVICRIDDGRGLIDEASSEPLVPPWDDPGPPDADRPTFIAIAVRHERGASLGGVHLQLVAPDGSPRYGVLDATGRWRTDDVPAGTCTLRFGDDLAKALEPAGPPVLVEADELWLGPDAALRLRLVTAREHRIVVVDGRTEVALVDEDDEPVVDRACVAKVGDRTLEGKFDADGRWRFHHPASIAACEITIVGTGASIVSSKGGEAE